MFHRQSHPCVVLLSHISAQLQSLRYNPRRGVSQISYIHTAAKPHGLAHAYVNTPINTHTQGRLAARIHVCKSSTSSPAGTQTQASQSTVVESTQLHSIQPPESVAATGASSSIRNTAPIKPTPSFNPASALPNTTALPPSTTSLPPNTIAIPPNPLTPRKVFSKNNPIHTLRDTLKSGHPRYPLTSRPPFNTRPKPHFKSEGPTSSTTYNSRQVQERYNHPGRNGSRYTLERNTYQRSLDTKDKNQYKTQQSDLAVGVQIGEADSMSRKRSRVESSVSLSDSDSRDEDGFIGVPDELLADEENEARLQYQRQKEDEVRERRQMDRLYDESRKNFLKNIKTPWKRGDYSQDVMISLHQEVLDFVEYCQPTASEHHERLEIIKKLRRLITSIWPKARLEVFGSFGTGLYTPTSDIDCVIFGEWSPHASKKGQQVFTLANKLQHQTLLPVKNLQKIAHARVPIVKFEDEHSGVAIDISFNQDGGVHTVQLVNNYIRQYPCLAPMVVLLKHFLAQRKLNEPVNGGVGSYSLTIMVLSFLQMHPGIKVQADTINYNLGVLLIDFFELYGFAFNWRELGISVRGSGAYFARDKAHTTFQVKKGQARGGQPNMAIEDPQQVGNNVGAASRRFCDVQVAFQQAHRTLNAYIMNENAPFSTALSSVIEVDEKFKALRDRATHRNKHIAHSFRGSPADASPFIQVWRQQSQQQNALGQNMPTPEVSTPVTDGTSYHAKNSLISPIEARTDDAGRGKDIKRSDSKSYLKGGKKRKASERKEAQQAADATLKREAPPNNKKKRKTSSAKLPTADSQASAHE